MEKFDNITIIKKANLYFDGQVSSRTLLFADGSKKTLGIMMPGEYEFDTSKAELMEIQTGKLDVLLPHCNDWQHFTSASSFYVPENTVFRLKVYEVTDYCCSYLD